MDRLYIAHVAGHSRSNSLGCMPDEEIVKLAQGGNHAACEFLIRRYRPLAEGRAKAYYLQGADRDDVVQEGMIGLYKAIRLPERATPFFSRLCRALRHPQDHHRR
jgi:DNA-directed RNA polymerase specialized sigma24 family protein